MLIINKNYNSNDDIKISNIEINIYYPNCYFICEKEKNTNMYFTYNLENIIKKNPDNFIKGKNNLVDLSKIQECQIPILSLYKQNTICNYIKNSFQLIKNNEININMYHNMKNLFLENILETSMITLNDIVEIVQEEINHKMICIIRNSLSAGDVSLYQGKLNNNSYYLISKNDNFLIEYIYYYLKFKEPNIKEMSRLTQQNNLIKTNLLNLKIPNINLKLQNDVINYCQDFDNHITSLLFNNQVIKNKDIFEIIHNF
jgi:restriction endonuclease S subunit